MSAMYVYLMQHREEELKRKVRQSVSRPSVRDIARRAVRGDHPRRSSAAIA